MYSTLVDDTTTYCDVSDVEQYVRAYSFDSTTDPTKSQVQSMIASASEKIDKRVDTAWRTREVADYTKSIELSHLQNSPGVSYRTRASGAYTHTDPWALVRLPNRDIESIQKVEVITDHGIEDVTNGEGDDYRVDYRKGMLRPHVSLVQTGHIRQPRKMSNRPRIRVTYTYGRTQIPDDIRDACARLVVADIVTTDTYGEVLPQADDMTPSEVADNMETTAWDAIDNYKYNDLMM